MRRSCKTKIKMMRIGTSRDLVVTRVPPTSQTTGSGNLQAQAQLNAVMDALTERWMTPRSPSSVTDTLGHG
jgi:hypothetical protein